MHNRGNITSSTYQETTSSTISGGGIRGSPSAPSFGHVRITQTGSSERKSSTSDFLQNGSYLHNSGIKKSPGGSGINKESYYDRRYSISTSGGYISSGQMNGDVSYQRRTPLSQQTNQQQQFHRRYSVTTDKIYNRDDSIRLNGADNLDFEAEEYLAKEIRPYASRVRKVTRQTRNHYSSPSGSTSPSTGDLGSAQPYLSPYRRVQSPNRMSPVEPLGGRTSPQIFIRRRTPGVRAGSMSRIETLESLRENKYSDEGMDVDRRVRHGTRRAMSVARGGGSARRAVVDLVDVELGSQPMDLGYEDDSYELRRQLRLTRNRTRASSASRLDPRERAGSVPTGEVRVIYPPRYPVSSITSPGGSGSVVNSSGGEIHIVQSMGSRSPRRRAASVSRVSYTGGVPRVIESPLPGASHRPYRASSHVAGSSRVYTAASASAGPYVGESAASYVRMSSTSSETGSRVRDPTLYGSLHVGDEEDLTRYVLDPGEKFLPTDVSVSTLPSGKKAVTYTRFRQTGSGDQRQANIEIERIIQKTKKLQESLNTLEDFVRRNRSLFPEDIIIYQKIIFYLLGEDELRAHGYPPDAEVYGVKIREKLVAPYGTDVAAILKRHYKRYTEVDVIYEEREAIRRRLRQADLETREEQELEEARRRKRRLRVDTEIIEEEEEWLRRRREAARRRRDQDEIYIDDEDIYRRPAGYSPARRAPRDDGAEPPQFSAVPKGRTVGLGDTVKFSCAVLGYPEPTIQWFHDNRPIFNSSRHMIDDRYIGSSSLCIRNVQKEDAGSYTARAVNMHGEVAATAPLYIEEDELTRRKEALRRPWFIHEVHNTTTQVGQMVVLEAQATGKPLPTFRWQRNNLDLVEDLDHVRIVSDGAGGTKLMIRDVRTSDAGLYVCIAENSAGRTACSATLRVGETFDLTEYYTVPKFGDLPELPDLHRSHHPVPQQPQQLPAIAKSRLPQLPFELDDIIMKNWNNPAGFYLDFDGEEPSEGRKPRFVKVPSTHITVQEGDPLTLRCKVEGYPKPLVKWYKGVRELTYTGRHRVLAEGNDCHMMQIRMTMMTDPGEYTIVALNSCGMVKYTIFVNVTPRSPEEVEETRKRPEHALQEYELIKKTAQGKMAPVFIRRLPREKEIIVGGTLKIECHVDEAKMKEYVVGYDVIVKDAEKGSHQSSRMDTNQTRPVPQPSLSSSYDVQDRATNLPATHISSTSSSVQPQSSETLQADSVVPESDVAEKSKQLTSSENVRKPSEMLEDFQAVVSAKAPSEAIHVSVEAETKPADHLTTPADAGTQAAAEVSFSSSEEEEEEMVVEESYAKTAGAAVGLAAHELQTGDTAVSETAVSDQAEVAAAATDMSSVEASLEAAIMHSADIAAAVAEPATAVTSAVVETEAATAPTTSLAAAETAGSVAVPATSSATVETAAAESLHTAAAESATLDSTQQLAADGRAAAAVLVGEGPRFLTSLESNVAPVGTTATFTCSVTGQPPLNVLWSRDGTVLEESDAVKIVNHIADDGMGSCRLEISNISPVDEGTYTVTVSNNFGDCCSTATLSIIGKVVPQISITFDDDDDDDDELSELSAEND